MAVAFVSAASNVLLASWTIFLLTRGFASAGAFTPSCTAATVAAAPKKRRRSWLVASDMALSLLWRAAQSRFRKPGPRLFGDAANIWLQAKDHSTINSQFPTPAAASC
jgi:hypothetical protein